MLDNENDIENKTDDHNNVQIKSGVIRETILSTVFNSSLNDVISPIVMVVSMKWFFFCFLCFEY